MQIDNTKKNIIILLSLFILLILFFYPVFFKNYVLVPLDILVGFCPWSQYYKGESLHNYIQTDALMLYYPWRKFASECIREKILPLWNPYTFSGTPFLANPQAAIFYPLNVLFYILPIEYAYTYQTILHLFLAGIFMYFYLQIIKLTKFSSFIGALLFMFNPFFIAWLVFPTFLSTTIWLPLILLLIEKINNERKFIYSVLLGIILCIQFLGGHPQLSFYIVLITLLYCFYKFIFTSNKFKFVYLIFFSVIISLLLSAIQLLPTLEFTQLIVRGKEVVKTAVIPFTNVILFFIPNFFGSPVERTFWANHNYTEFHCYLGILPLFLAIFGIVNKDNKNNIFFTTFLVLFFLVTFIEHISKLVFNLPLFDRFRAHNRLIYLYSFCLCCLAAIGLDYIISNKNKTKIISITLLSAIIFASIVSLCWHSIQEEYKIPFNKLLEFEKNNLITLSIIFLCSLIILNFKFLKFLVILLIICDVFISNKDYNVIMDPKKINFIATETTELLKKDKDIFRIARMDRPSCLIPNTSIVYKIQDAEGCDTFILRDYGNFCNKIYPQQERLKMNFVAPLVREETYNSQLIDFLNIKYVITAREIIHKKYKLLLDDKGIKIYKNEGYFPRAFIVYKARVMEDRKKILDELKKIDLREEVIVEGARGKGQEIRGKGQGVKGKGQEARSKNYKLQTTIIKYSPNEVIINTNLTKPGYLVLSDVYYPGWEVYVNNEKDKIYRANYCFRSVKLDKGKHEVRFVFEPKSYKIGLYITSSTLLLILVFFIVNLKRGKG